MNNRFQVEIRVSAKTSDAETFFKAIRDYVLSTDGMFKRYNLEKDIVMLLTYVPFEILYTVQDTILKMNNGAFWCQYMEIGNPASARIGAYSFEENILVYKMCGSLQKGKSLEDGIRKTNPYFDIECPKEEAGVLCWVYDKNQLYIRVYEESRLIIMIDGIIEIDLRKEPKEYFYI